MPFVVLVLVALPAGLLGGLAAWRGGRITPAGALVLAAGGAVLVTVLAALVSTHSRLIGFDRDVADWAHRRASAWSTDALNGVTHLGSIYTVVILGVALAAAETTRTRNPWIVPFLVAAVGGEELLTRVLKQLVDRPRPAFDPAAATLGPAFPSGHSANAAAFYAAAALLLARGRGRVVRASLAGAAVALPVAVAVSRVFLEVHWVTDVIGGLALGSAWLVVCRFTFGDHRLRYAPRNTST